MSRVINLRLLVGHSFWTVKIRYVLQALDHEKGGCLNQSRVKGPCKYCLSNL